MDKLPQQDQKEESSTNAPQFEIYNKIKLLGEGAFGKAFLVQCESDKSYAVIK
jgi:hypothetical protein